MSESNELLLKSDEITYLTQKYNALQKNRLQAVADQKKRLYQQKSISKNKLGERVLDKPRISRATSALAQKKDPRRASMSIHERLLAEKELR